MAARHSFKEGENNEPVHQGVGERQEGKPRFPLLGTPTVLLRFAKQNEAVGGHAPVAQRIERQPPELDAVGSNPAGRALFLSRRRDLKGAPRYIAVAYTLYAER